MDLRSCWNKEIGTTDVEITDRREGLNWETDAGATERNVRSLWSSNHARREEQSGESRRGKGNKRLVVHERVATHCSVDEN